MQVPEVDPAITKPPMPTQSLYEQDFYAWTQAQTKWLRDQQWNHLDLPNLIEEIESLGKQQRQELRNRLSVFIGHLLKWEYQPQRRSRSWLATLRIQRRDTLHLLNDNPSLKPYLEEALQDTYENARDLAMAETDFPDETFPRTCPYPFTEILDSNFYPSEPSALTNMLMD